MGFAAQAVRGAAAGSGPRPSDPAAMAATIPPAESGAGRDWRADWARLRKLSANGNGQR